MRILDEIRPLAFLNAIPDGIVVLDSTFRILYQNATHEDIFGRHVGRKCKDAYECGQVICDRCPLECALEDGERHVSTRRIHHPNGDRYVEIAASTIRNSWGRVVAGVELVRDITERVHAEQARERLLEREKNSRTEAENALRHRDALMETGADELKAATLAVSFQLQGLARAAGGES
ncbi:MAG: PAS domain-containing protein, partial [Candidatus Hydrogenedentota bacterium]